MSKNHVHAVCVGQLQGAKLDIVTVYNDGLTESVTITNHGTVDQPMNGWVLASLRGQLFYVFPEALFLAPGASVKVHSGQQSSSQILQTDPLAIDLYWTNVQVWNNQGDTAVLFDAEGVEVGCYVYPHDRVLKSSSKRPRKLLQGPEGYTIVSSLDHRNGRMTRQIKASEK